MTKSQNRVLAAVVGFSLAASVSTLSAQTSGLAYVPTKLTRYTATSAAWRTDGFQSVIRLKNMLTISGIDVNLTLYMADGTPYSLPDVHLGAAAVTTISINAALDAALNEIYEMDFKGFSYGFRPGRSPHQALDSLSVGLHRKRMNWVLDADIRGFLDTASYCPLVHESCSNSSGC